MRDLIMGFALIAIVALIICWLLVERDREQYSKIEVFYNNGQQEIYENVTSYRAHPKLGYWIIITKDYELFLELKGVKYIAVTSRR